jgi:hypothetical protein
LVQCLDKSAKKKPIAFAFVVEALEQPDSPLPMTIRPMFGCHAVYIGDKIVLILRERTDHQKDNGIWIATTLEHHKALKKDFPTLRSIEIFGPGPTGWQVLPSKDEAFEEDALKLVRLVLKEDLRIGKIPKKKKSKKIKKP